jgi:cell division protein ZapB
MNNDTFPQLEQLIDQLITQNQKLHDDLAQLQAQNTKLVDENETLQLEVLENEEKNKEASHSLSTLLSKLQNATQVS